MNRLLVIKIGGNIIDDDVKLSSFLSDFASIKQKKILVHGGGKLATRIAEQLGIEQKMVDGRRITDAETLRVVTMVYAGFINKNIVAVLQQHGCNAVGITGADGNAIIAHKRMKGQIDYGFAGDIDNVNTGFFDLLLRHDHDIIVAPVTHDKSGQLLNTNADTIAQEIATAMSGLYNVSLVYGFEKAGVLMDAENDDTVIPVIKPSLYSKLKTDNIIFAGMIPKLDNAFAAVNKGVKKVIIGKSENIAGLIEGNSGTTIKL
ncbi:MAG TPA: acetylglutamate kinase [Flavitalea sp.]|nr:acetylglutamate kinase [Flavitalea sp.]